MRRGESRFTAMQKELAMMGMRVKKKVEKKPKSKKIELPKNIFDARRLGMQFLSEARFGARTEIGFKHRILTSQDPERIRRIIEEILEAKKKKK